MNSGQDKKANEHTDTAKLHRQIEEVSHPTVEISPIDVVTRRTLSAHGITVESVRYSGRNTVAYRFCAAQHLLVAYGQVERASGETFVEGMPSSTPRSLSGRLTIVPAGCEFRERHESRTNTHLTFFYFDPTLPALTNLPFDNTAVGTGARLLFEDLPLWNTAIRLSNLADDSADSADNHYFYGLSIVLACDLVRSVRTVPPVRPLLKGGLASWQQRIVASYIKENFAKKIPLATLARIARLSPFHFCRAFRQSFGVTPQRYQNERRIDHAKQLLEQREMSMTEIGLEIGFRSLSAFASAFRKATGLSPSTYLRSITL
jgi:AraC family transcriptional regulator